MTVETPSPQVGNIVYVPCQVVGTGVMAFTEEMIDDLRPIESESGVMFGENVVRKFSVYARDVKVAL